MACTAHQALPPQMGPSTAHPHLQGPPQVGGLHVEVFKDLGLRGLRGEWVKKPGFTKVSTTHSTPTSAGAAAGHWS